MPGVSGSCHCVGNRGSCAMRVQPADSRPSHAKHYSGSIIANIGQGYANRTASRAPAMPEVEHTDESVSSLVDVDSPHISSVPSDYESQSVKTDTQAERQEREREIKQEAKNLKNKAAAKKESAKDKAQKNADNPVVLANAVGAAVLTGVLGIGAYRKYARGELTGKVVAAWMGVVGLFGIGDYYVSK
jgi:F0F1-type ATP synthase assembly protein I